MDRNDITILKPEPGDIILVKCERRISMSAVEQLRNQMHDAFPGNRVMILYDGIDMSLLTGPDIIELAKTVAPLVHKELSKPPMMSRLRDFLRL